MGEDTIQTKNKPKMSIRTFAMDLEEERAKSSGQVTAPKKTEEIGEEVKTIKTETEKRIPPAPKIDRSKLKPREEEVKVDIPQTPIPKNKPAFTSPKIATPIPKANEIKKETVTPPVPTIRSPKPTKIPAFHELNKKTKESPAISEQKNKEESKITVTENTSQKKNGGFFSVLKKLFTFSKKQRNTPTYTVPDTNRRKGVIQKATSKSGAIFTADSEELKERIRHRQAREKIDDDTETSWSPYTETGFNLLEAPEITSPTNVTVEFKNRSIPDLVNQTYEEPDASEIEPEEATVPLTDYYEPEIDVEESIEVETTDTNIPDNETGEAYDEEVVENELVKEIGEQEITEKKVETGIVGRFLNLNTNSQALSLLSFFVLSAVIFFTVNIVIDLFKTPVSMPEETLVIIPTAEQIYLEINDANINQFVSELSEKVTNEPDKFAEITIINQDKKELSPEIILENSPLNPPTNLVREINSIRFIASNDARPSIIMSIANKETVLGNILRWEDKLVDELDVIYSFDKREFINGEYIDESVNGRDMRIYHTGETHIFVYGFIDDNTLLIAQNRETFEKIARLKSN